MTLPGRTIPARSARWLRWTAVAFAIGLAVHVADHARRGIDASPPGVLAIGSVQGILVAGIVWLAWSQHPRAPLLAALAGFGSALLVTSGHLLPAATSVSDSFVSPPHVNVNVFSWASAFGEIATGVAFGAAGILAWVDRKRAAGAERRARRSEEAG